MSRSLKICLALAALTGLAGCSGTDYSPNTYASNAAQQASKVEAGIVIGFREVLISANGTVGAVTGGAAGGVLGSQVGGGNVDQALGGVIGTAVGSVIGTTIEHVTGDTKGWEYIVRKHNGDMVSVTQTEPKPLALGQKVLVISSAQQARIVADYSIDIPVEKAKDEKKSDEKKAEERKPEQIKSDDRKPDEDKRSEEPVRVPVADKPTVSDLPPPPAPQAAAPTEPTELPTAGSWSP